MKRITLLIIFSSIFLLVIGCTAKENKLSLPEGTPAFVQESDFERIDWDRSAVEFTGSNIIGNENKSGVIGINMPSLETQKWMWHLWGNESSNMTVVGFHKQTKTVHQILTGGWTLDLMGPNNGADAHAPSNVKIPESGEWAFLLYSGEELFDVLVYDINE